MDSDPFANFKYSKKVIALHQRSYLPTIILTETLS